MKQFTLACALGAALFAAGCDQSSNDVPSRAEAAGLPPCKVIHTDQIGGPISLIDHSGAAVTEENYRGRDSLVYFGYTYCPDICPVALTVVGAALDMVPDDIETPRTLLISVDPERDTPEALAQYIESNGFPDDLTGLTGSAEQVDAAAKVFRAVYKIDPMPDSAAGYTVSHSSYLYMMDENWKLKTVIPVDLEGRVGPREVAGCIADLGEPASSED